MFNWYFPIKVISFIRHILFYEDEHFTQYTSTKWLLMETSFNAVSGYSEQFANLPTKRHK